MWPTHVIIDDKTIIIEEYCENHCPQRYNSECWSDCDLKREYEKQENEDEPYCYEDDDDDW